MKTHATITMVLMLLASTSIAGPIKTTQVAGDAKWVAHVDVEVLLKSGIAKFLLTEAENKPDFVNKITDLRQDFGFELKRDVRGVTMYGKEIGSKSGVIVLDMTVDQQKVREWMTANKTHKETQYGSHTLHEWTNPTKAEPKDDETCGKTSFGVFYDAKTVVVASSLKLLKGAIDVLDRKAKSLAVTKGLPMLPKSVAGDFFVAAANDIEMPAMKDKPQVAMFKDVTQLSLRAGENKKGTFAEIVAKVGNEKSAAQLKEVIQGFVALGQIMMADREDLSVLGDSITVTNTGGTVNINASMPTDSLIKMIKVLHERKAKMKALREAR